MNFQQSALFNFIDYFNSVFVMTS